MLITPIDKSKETEGIEVTYYGVKFVIARANNTNFKHMFKTLFAPHKYQLENNQSIPESVSEDIILKCYSNTILVGWSECFDKDKKEIKYSKQKAYELLKEDEDAFDFVKKQSGNIDSFMKKDEEITEKK